MANTGTTDEPQRQPELPGPAAALPPGSHFCYACGSQIDARAFICPRCGVRQPAAAAPGDGRLDPGVAALVAIIGSSVVAMLILKRFGLAALYLGEILIGVLLTIVLIGFLILPALWAGGAYHAYKLASEQQSRASAPQLQAQPAKPRAGSVPHIRRAAIRSRLDPARPSGSTRARRERVSRANQPACSGLSSKEGTHPHHLAASGLCSSIALSHTGQRGPAAVIRALAGRAPRTLARPRAHAGITTGASHRPACRRCRRPDPVRIADAWRGVRAGPRARTPTAHTGSPANPPRPCWPARSAPGWRQAQEDGPCARATGKRPTAAAASSGARSNSRSGASARGSRRANQRATLPERAGWGDRIAVSASSVLIGAALDGRRQARMRGVTRTGAASSTL